MTLATTSTTTTAHAAPPASTVEDPAGRRTVLLAQAVASLGLAAGGAAGGLLAVGVTGDQTTAAAPLGALVLGAGCSAPLAAAVMQRRGRRAGLQLGYTIGALGAAVVVAGAWLAWLPVLLTGNLLLGAGTTAVMLSRYVVADLTPPDHRGRAISTSMLSITLGAVIGPNLLGPTSTLATAVGLPGPAGLYIIALLVFAVAPVLLASTSRHRTPPPPAGPALVVAAPTADAPDRAGTTQRRTAYAVLTTANIAMVGVMAVAPVHLDGHGHELGLVGLLVSLHVGAMSAASPVIGRLVDNHGSRTIAAAGAVAFLIVGLLPTIAGADLAATTLLLVGLGVAWNIQIIAGSALLHDATPPPRRPTVEARGELAMSIGAAGASLLLAGPLLAAGGLPLLAAALASPHLLVLVLLRRTATS